MMSQTARRHDRAAERAEIVVSRSAQPLHPVVRRIAENLAELDVIRTVKVTPGALEASSETKGVRKQPVATPGHPTAIGVSLILDVGRGEIQFYEITSAVKGYGARMVEAVVLALPKDWKAFVLMDWSDGFWKVMRRRHRKILLL